MNRKFYEQPTIVILRLESEVWFTETEPSMNYDNEKETGDGSDFDPWS
ncbi:MAG: hypothetical protein IJY05_02870 [Clostridia bacterium]|nr:hypothetical protein [Clostridia bacterium]